MVQVPCPYLGLKLLFLYVPTHVNEVSAQTSKNVKAKSYFMYMYMYVLIQSILCTIKFYYILQ